MTTKRATAVMVAAAIFTLALFAGVFYASPDRAEAAPAAQPTAIQVYPGSGMPQIANFLRAREVNTSTVIYSPMQNLQQSEKVDLQWVVVPLSTPNALSIQLQYSNDGTNWIDGPYAIATPMTTTNDMQQFPVFGRYGRIAVEATNANPVEVTVIGLGK